MTAGCPYSNVHIPVMCQELHDSDKGCRMESSIKSRVGLYPSVNRSTTPLCPLGPFDLDVVPLYTVVERFVERSGRFVSWHSAEAVTRRIRLSWFL